DHSFYDNEDKFRSRFKIRGKENIKTSLLREIRKKFGKISKKKTNLDNPDITINVQIGKKFETNISVISSTVILRGRYIKSKGFRIESKNSTPYDRMEINQRNIEKLLKKVILNKFNSDSITFWPVGKEEPETRVLGNGRPFYVSIKNSKIINFKQSLSIKSNGILFKLIEKVRTMPTSTPLYVKKVLTLVSFQEKLRTNDLRNFTDSGILIVELINRKNKNWKFIYQMDFRLKTPRKLELTMTCDNGLPVRKFVEGEDADISPTLGQIVGRKCSCEKTDILDILNEDLSI
ncbi:MAG TPA: THUMP domain-containing protein, partial [Nitrososphaeraceae archaeon]|nr:THUMP domain-containing protein [Nitrososphaeraceae archaeon]